MEVQKMENMIYVKGDSSNEEWNAHPVAAVIIGPEPNTWTGEIWGRLAGEALREVVGPGWFLELLDYLASLKVCPAREWCAVVKPDKCALAWRLGKLLELPCANQSEKR